MEKKYTSSDIFWICMSIALVGMVAWWIIQGFMTPTTERGREMDAEADYYYGEPRY